LLLSRVLAAMVDDSDFEPVWSFRKLGRRDPVKVQLVPSSVGIASDCQFCIGALINETVAIDAGSIGQLSPLNRQKSIRHIFLSHSHLDHIATLPVFLDNVYEPGPDSVTVYASEATQCALRENFFNEKVWPDLLRLSRTESPFLNFVTLSNEEPVEVESLKITPVELNHTVPTFGFIVQSLDSAIAIVSDTAPTTRIWQLLNNLDALRAVFVEASFPNSHRWLAEASKHLCPEQLAEELSKLSVPGLSFVATHLKPAFRAQIVSELESLNIAGLQVGAIGFDYSF
jgi:cAMP phosphodiesterase